MDNTRIEVLKEIISKILPHVLKDSDAEDEGFSCEDKAVPPGHIASDSTDEILKDLDKCTEEDDEAAPEMPTKKREPRIVEISIASISPKKLNKQSEVQEILGKKPRK